MKFFLVNSFRVIAILMMSFSAARAKTTDVYDAVIETRSILETMTETQRSRVQLAIDDPRRRSWHYYPEDIRDLPLEGLPLDAMNEAQRSQVRLLLESLLSPEGQRRVRLVFRLEELLRKHDSSGIVRNPFKYHFTVYGEPSEAGAWALSFEGHHLSLNFAFRGNDVVSGFPLAFGANPETIYSELAETDLPAGTNLVSKEEALAISLVSTFSSEQVSMAKLSDVPDVDPRDVGSQCLTERQDGGIAWAELDRTQREQLLKLIATHVKILAPKQARTIWESWLIRRNEIRFWWKGSIGVSTPYSYGIETDRHSVELAMAQVALDGRPANHAHLVLRGIASGSEGCP